jgi:hypothetical protein
MSPNGASFDLAVRLEFMCMNNQAKYGSLLYVLEYLRDMSMRRVEAWDQDGNVGAANQGGRTTSHR